MLDDPLGLAVQMIFVLAAGMYPVGFLFGVCSDCCGCKPCNLCSAAYIGCVPESVTVTFDGQTETYNVADMLPDDPVLFTAWGNNYIVDYNTIPLADLTPFVLFTDQCEGETLTARIGFAGFEYATEEDECGCLKCGLTVQYFYAVDYGGDRFPSAGLEAELAYATTNLSVPDEAFYSFVPHVDYCQGSPIEIDFVSGDASMTNLQRSWGESVDDGFYPEACHPTNDLLDVPMTVSFTFAQSDIDECDCGACCVSTTCTPNVPESYCESEGGLGGVWQGIGTTCNPNPCD